MKEQMDIDPLTKKQKILFGIAIITFYIAHNSIIVWIFS